MEYALEAELFIGEVINRKSFSGGGMAARTGTNGNDTLIGTTSNATLNGLDGDDLLDGGGADTMNAARIRYLDWQWRQ
jgi:Ca2+-binding RTX toxin-like protein